ncbi:response regulator transcription factor [Paenibacillus endoradicis]|uniref:response regulator transcription factor n=1 Tax=Paenibacillus endoradicis TaxID=2972487 RepID=UPI0021591CB3|nr:response regulator transcription factor [Paenibacillus endoradicis]MCR8659948.1 response regulator transcription factor [Paenibacillus endoradicis]
MPIKLLIIDDHPEMASSISSLIQQEDSITIIGITDSLTVAISLIERLYPHIVLLDLNMPEETGITLCSKLKERFPGLHIIIHTGYDYVPYFNQLVDSGASGMLNKSASPSEIIAMIDAVLHGHTIIPLPLFRQIKLHRSEEVKHYWEMDLTPTERSILSMVSDKYTNALIARKIHVSESSVEKYLRKIYEKLGVRNKNEAVERIQQDERFHLVRVEPQ